MAAKKKAKKTDEKRKPKVKYPPKQDRCEKVLVAKDAFHKKSFRNMFVPSKKNGDSIVLVGCPKKAGIRGAPQKYYTTWVETKAAFESKTQCRFREGPKKNKKAGMKAHAVTQKKHGGKCRSGYKTLKKLGKD